MDMNAQLRDEVERFNREHPDAPDIVMENVRLRAEVERLTAERAAIAQALDDDCAPDIDRDRVKTLADRVNALLGHWQDEIRGALCASVPDPHRIDGGGCDSGDPLDLTLAEVAQAVNQLADQVGEQIAALTAERDAARAYAAGCEAAADSASNDLEDMREECDAARICRGWVSGASMEWGTVTIKIDEDPESVAGTYIGVKARAVVYLLPYPETTP